jgi:hypothetical protein
MRRSKGELQFSGWCYTAGMQRANAPEPGPARLTHLRPDQRPSRLLRRRCPARHVPVWPPRHTLEAAVAAASHAAPRFASTSRGPDSSAQAWSSARRRAARAAGQRWPRCATAAVARPLLRLTDAATGRPTAGIWTLIVSEARRWTPFRPSREAIAAPHRYLLNQ